MGMNTHGERGIPSGSLTRLKSAEFNRPATPSLTCCAAVPAAPASVRAAVVATSKACRTVRPMTMERSVCWVLGGDGDG